MIGEGGSRGSPSQSGCAQLNPLAASLRVRLSELCQHPRVGCVGPPARSAKAMPAALGEEGAIVQRAGYRADLDSADLGGEALCERARMARSLLLRALASRPRDAIGICLAIAGVAAVSINALYLQPGPHPAPIFAIKSRTNAAAAVRVPRPRPGDLAKAESGARPQSAIIADIQRELERRGFYEGPIDGFHGPRTDAAIRDFEQTIGLQPAVEPGKELLQIILRSPARRPAASQLPALQNSVASSRGDAIGSLIASS